MRKARTIKFWKSFERVLIKNAKSDREILGDEMIVLWKSDLKRVWNANEKIEPYWKRKTMTSAIFIKMSWHWTERKQESSLALEGKRI